MAKRFTDLMLKVRGKEKHEVGASDTVKIIVSREAAITGALKILKSIGMLVGPVEKKRLVGDSDVSEAALKLLVDARLVTISEDRSDRWGGSPSLVTVRLHAFSCGECVHFRARESNHVYDKCLERKIDLVMPQMNQAKCRSCSAFFPKALEVV